MQSLNQKIINKFRDIGDKKIFLFQVATFFLPSMFSISALILAILVLTESINNKENVIKDKFNFLFLLSSLFMIFGSIFNFIKTDPVLIDKWDPNLSLIGLFNWIPLFYMFWITQRFLDTREKRKNFAIALLAGTFPLLVSGFCQYFLNIHGPYEILYGLIIWYQRPIIYPDEIGFIKNSGLTSVFNNANYAGTWLSTILPISITGILVNEKNKINTFIAFLFTISLIISIILTKSRNAWIGIIIAFLLLRNSFDIKNINRKQTSIFFIIFIPFLLKIRSFAFLRDNLLGIINLKFPTFGFNEISNYPRIAIWRNSLDLSLDKPLFGWGASTFDKLFQLPENLTTVQNYFAHTHSIPLSLSVSYGIPVAIFISINILFIIYESLKIFLKKNNFSFKESAFDYAIFISLIVIAISQLFDNTYFDGRISFLFWLLLSSCVSLIKEKEFNKNQFQKI